MGLSKPCLKCRAMVQCTDRFSRQWRAGLCQRHWLAHRLATAQDGRKRLLKYNKTTKHQRRAALTQWSIAPGSVRRGRMTPPRVIYFVKSNHWVNSGGHIRQGRAGTFEAAGLLTVSTCKRHLRQVLASDFAASNHSDLSAEGAYVVFVGSAVPSRENTDAPYHSTSNWKANVAGRGLAAVRVCSLLPPKAAAKLKRRLPGQLENKCTAAALPRPLWPGICQNTVAGESLDIDSLPQAPTLSAVVQSS